MSGCLPHENKRRHDLLKKLDKPIKTNGWRIFVAAQAYAILNGKTPQRRNAELMLLEMAMRWRRDVLELLPDRVGDLEKIVSIGIANPAPLPNKK